jgi:pyruvate/2-oxoglutarate dehydrogenase complex dihydrolipoamide acyltransferase (E2) component
MGSCGGSSSKPVGVKGQSEIKAEPVSSTGANPFTSAVGKDTAGVTPPAAASSSGGPSTYNASLPGLYGGTRNYATCDAEKLVTFLEANAAKAGAWATTLGIQTTQIRSYVSGLTAVTLRTDTRVTNHGYVNGEADAIQSVLQAGTAVFVDKYGRPVVKCYCGNPLTPPVLYSAPRYTGPLWSGFESSHITIIQQSITIIDTFNLFDPKTGETFARPAGSSGQSDGPYLQRGPSTTTTPAPAETTPPPASPPASTPAAPTSPPATAENPSASFSPNPGKQGDTFTFSVSGFKPGSQVAFALTRPDGIVEHFTIAIGSDGTGERVFTNTGQSVTGTYSATATNRATEAQASASLYVAPSSEG